MKWELLGDATKHRIKVGSKSLRVTVQVSWAYEDEAPEVAWDDPQSEAEYYARFESGELANVVIRVQAFWQDADGSDCLGACHVRSSHFEEDISDLVRDHAMIDGALNDLKETIVRRSKVYAGLSELA